MSEKDFLTVHDIAQELGLTARTVRRLFSIGKLQGKKVAGKYIITREALKEFINDRYPPCTDGCRGFPFAGRVYMERHTAAVKGCC